MLPVNDMMLFADVVKYKSFTTAAQKNELTPAGVSKRVSKLEMSLGVELLKRTTRTLALTEAGALLYDHCRNMHMDIQGVIDTISEVHKKPKGIIKLSALQNVSNLILAPLLDTFLQEYKDIEVAINLDGALGPLPPIGEYDIAFRSGKLIDSSAISRLLFTHNYVVCASPTYLRRHGTPTSVDDLKNHNCVDCQYTNKREENTWTFFHGDDRYSIPVRGNVFSNNALLIKNMALHNLTLIYSPSFLVAEEINKGQLIQLLPQYKTMENSIYIVHPYTNGNVPKRIRTFIDYLIVNMRVPTIDRAPIPTNI